MNAPPPTPEQTLEDDDEEEDEEEEEEKGYSREKERERERERERGGEPVRYLGKGIPSGGTKARRRISSGEISTWILKRQKVSKRTKKRPNLPNTALLFSFTFLERRRLRKARKYPQHARAHTHAGLHRNERRARYEHVNVDTVVRIESLVGKSILLLVTKIDVEIFSSEGEEKRSDVSN